VGPLWHGHPAHESQDHPGPPNHRLLHGQDARATSHALLGTTQPTSSATHPHSALCPASPASGSLFRRGRSWFIIPAQAGIHFAGIVAARGFWIPASVGMTESLSGLRLVSQIVTRPRCLLHKTRHPNPASSAFVGPCAIVVCHSRGSGNPLRRIFRRPCFLDSCPVRQAQDMVCPCHPDCQGGHTLARMPGRHDGDCRGCRHVCRCSRLPHLHPCVIFPLISATARSRGGVRPRPRGSAGTLSASRLQRRGERRWQSW